MSRIILTVMAISLIAGCGADEVSFVGNSDGVPLQTINLIQGEVGERYVQQAETQREQFQQDLKEAKLDLLIVMDNSGSMQPQQGNMASRMEALLSSVSDADWQIAVTTTDTSDPCIIGTLRRGEPNLNSRFHDLMTQGTNGSPREMGIFTAERALRMPAGCNTAPWVRPDSVIAVLIVSDEDNCSLGLRLGNDCPGAPHQRADYLINYLSSVRTVGETARVYGLIWVPGTSCPSAAQSGGRTGNVYMTAIQATGGQAGSICDADYSNTLNSISKDMSVILNRQFKLAYNPDPRTVIITINDVQLSPSEFSIRDRTVALKNAPADGASIVIKYDPLAADQQTSFAIRKGAEEDIFVMINGRLLLQDEYVVDRVNHRVDLAYAVSAGATVLIFYGERSLIRKEFEIKKGINPNFIYVFINDEEAKDHYSYNPATGMLVFEKMPPEGSRIRINYAP